MKRPPRIVVVGAAGRLGQALVARFARDASVLGLARPQIDLSSPQSIRDALEPLKFDHLLLPAAMTAVDACETNPDQAYAINATAPGLIAGICAEKKAHMTHFSTDFVFDGAKQGAYTEGDEARPLGIYGDSKLQGEQAVLAASPYHLVARVSWLYGPGKPAFPEWIVDQACNHRELALPGDKTGSPVSSVDIADMLHPLLFGPAGEPARGLFHLCNSGSCTHREWGQACLDLAVEAGAPLRAREIVANTLAEVRAFVARRPPNSVLSTSKYTAFTGLAPRLWQDALREHFATSTTLRKYQAATCG
jgi:dTDP-4-dehydrorhamnose reductase